MPPKKSTKETIPLSTSEGVSTRSQYKKGGKKQEPKRSKPIEEGKIETLFDNLRTDYLGDICKAAGIKAQKARKDITESLLKEFAKAGEKKLLEKVNKDLLKEVIGVVEKVEHDNKSKMEKTIKELLEKHGQKEFFMKLSVSQLDQLSQLLGFQEVTASQEEKVNGLIQELIYAGAKVVFHELKKDQLVDIAVELELEKNGSKEDVLFRILGKVYPEQAAEDAKKPKEEKSEPEPVAPVEVKPIAKGVSKEDLYQHYTKDLQEFASKNGLKKTGNKRDLINNIHRFLEGDVEGTRALKPGEAAKIKKAKKEELKRKRAASAKPKANKDSTDKDAPAAKKQKTA